MKQQGLSLIELMIAMVLGLVLLGSLSNIFLATRQVYQSNEGLSQLQESARTTFELLARDIRQASLAPCGNKDRIANVVNNASTKPYLAWTGLQGFDNGVAADGVTIGTSVGERISATSAILVQGIEGNGVALVSHDAAAGAMKVAASSSGFNAGDILMACDPEQSSIFQLATATVDGTNTDLTYSNEIGTPGNCSMGLGFPISCSSAAGNPYTYDPNTQISRFYSAIWYIGNNGREAEGGRSLYRMHLVSGALVAEEMVAGISNLQAQYHLENATDWVDAAAVASWDSVDAVKLVFNFASVDDNLSTDTSGDGRLTNEFTLMVALRNQIS